MLCNIPTQFAYLFLAYHYLYLSSPVTQIDEVNIAHAPAQDDSSCQSGLHGVFWIDG